MEYGLSFMSGLISLALTIWLVYFSVLVIQKLDKIIELLSTHHHTIHRNHRYIQGTLESLEF